MYLDSEWLRTTYSGMDFSSSIMRRNVQVLIYSFHALYTILAPYFSPFLSTTWLLQSSTLMAFTNLLGSTQKPLRDPRAGAPPTAGTSIHFPV